MNEPRRIMSPDEIVRAFRVAARDVQATLDQMRANIKARTKALSTPEWREARSIIRYKREAERQRQIGLDFVKADAIAKRAALGLPNHPFDPGWSGQSIRCNHLVERDGYGDDCGLVRGAHPE